MTKSFKKTFFTLVSFSIVFEIILSCGVNGPDKNQSFLILENCTIIPMYQDTLLYKKNLVIQGKKIIAIDDNLSSEYIDQNTRKINCTGKFIIPGLFDSHFHYGRNEQLYKAIDSLLITYGVTNVFNMHGSSELADHINNEVESLIRPDIISTGRIQNNPYLVENTADSIIGVHKINDQEFIKIYTNLSIEGFQTYNDKAPAEGLRIVGHIPRKMGFYKILKSNLELICHAEEILYNEPFNYLMSSDKMVEPNYDLIDTVAVSMKMNQKWLSPTLISFHSILTQSKSDSLKFEGSELENRIGAYWNWFPPNNKIPSKFNSPEKRFRLEKAFLFQKLLVKSLNDQKVNMLAGTDAPAYWNLVPGKSLHKELQLLRSCGVSEYEVLKMATLNAARFLGVENDFGTIEVSKTANLIILNENPLVEIKNTLSIEKVIVNGKLLQ